MIIATGTRDISNFVSGFDTAFMLIFWVAVFFIVSITATMIYFIYRYNRKKNPVATQIEGSTLLEVIWTAIPLLLVLVMFWFGWTGWRPSQKPPEDALEITGIGRMWNFNFIYENGRMTDTLYVPQGEPVKVNLVAQDVLHSFYIPAFRIKQDMVPGKDGFMWFIANEPGEYDLFCAEYCGLRHAYMATSVIVMPKEEFDEWLTDTTTVLVQLDERPGAAGLSLIRLNGCIACHSLDGSKLVGPSFKDLYGSSHLVSTAGRDREILVDDEYIKRSIYEPDVDIVKGYSRGLMLSYKNLIDDQGIEDIIEYLKTISDK
jgi:cytochrome c oxidase subunit II